MWGESNREVLKTGHVYENKRVLFILGFNELVLLALLKDKHAVYMAPIFTFSLLTPFNPIFHFISHSALFNISFHSFSAAMFAEHIKNYNIRQISVQTYKFWEW